MASRNPHGLGGLPDGVAVEALLDGRAGNPLLFAPRQVRDAPYTGGVRGANTGVDRVGHCHAVGPCASCQDNWRGGVRGDSQVGAMARPVRRGPPNPAGQAEPLCHHPGSSLRRLEARVHRGNGEEEGNGGPFFRSGGLQETKQSTVVFSVH